MMLEEHLKTMRLEDAEASREMFELASRRLKLNIKGDTIVMGKIRELEIEREMLRRRRQAQYGELSMAAKAYSKSWCSVFFPLFFEKLSARELRDNVYTYLLDGIRTIDIRPLQKSAYEVNFADTGSYANFETGRPNGLYPVTTLQAYAGKNIPYYLNWEFVGSRLLIEVYPEVFKRAHFDIQHCYDMDWFLNVNGLGHPDFSPLQFVRNLTIHVTFEPHPHDYIPNNYTQWDEETRADGIKCRHTFKAGELSALCRIHDVSSLKLQIIMRLLSPEGIPRLEECLVPIIYDLKARGATVEVWAKVGKISMYSLAPFDVPREEWDERIRNNSAFP